MFGEGLDQSHGLDLSQVFGKGLDLSHGLDLSQVVVKF